MTEPPAGWSSPSGEPTPSNGTPPPPGYSTPPEYGAPPPPGYGTPSPSGYGTPPGYPTTPYAGPPGGWYGGPPPAPAPGVVPLRPLTLGELLDGAVKVIRRYPRPTIGLSALVALVTTLLNVLAVLLMDLSAEVDALSGDASTDVTFSGGTGASSVPGALVSFPAGIFLTGVLVAVVGRAVLGQEATIGEVWQQLRPRVWALLGLALLTGLIVAAPLLVVGILLALAAVTSGSTGAFVAIGLLLGLPASGLSAYLYVRLALAPAVLVLEKSGIRTSLRRSGDLVNGSWWRVFGVLLLTYVVSQLVASVLVLPVAIVGGITLLDGPSTADVALFLVLSQVASGLASCLVSPFSAGVQALLYVDRRMRAEALDLTLQAAARA